MDVNLQASYPIDSTNYLSSDPLPTGRQCEGRCRKHSFVVSLFIAALVIGMILVIYIIYRARLKRAKDGYIHLDSNENEQTTSD
jgi:cbb3-type cytochrome oxidase subunit 3